MTERVYMYTGIGLFASLMYGITQRTEYLVGGIAVAALLYMKHSVSPRRVPLDVNRSVAMPIGGQQRHIAQNTPQKSYGLAGNLVDELNAEIAAESRSRISVTRQADHFKHLADSQSLRYRKTYGLN